MMTGLPGPMEVFPGCNLWLVGFGSQRAPSPLQLEKDLAAAQMSSGDAVRWERFRPGEKKRQFLNSRLAVRAVLDQELGRASRNVNFDVDAHRRPLVLSADGSEVCQISLSHSGPVVAVAVSHGHFPIGVDIETVTALRTDALRLMAPAPRNWTGGTKPAEPMKVNSSEHSGPSKNRSGNLFGVPAAFPFRRSLSNVIRTA